MENLIEKIEEYQLENNKKWEEIMILDTADMSLSMARLIGFYQSQLEIIKNDLKNGK